jgi:hypothetical protein
MYIRIVEASELTPDLRLSASDYMTKENRVSTFTHQRMETGKFISAEAVKELSMEENEVPALAVDQLWEITEARVYGKKGGAQGTRPATRRVKIVSIGETHVEADNVETGLRRTIRLAAFNGKGKKSYYPVTDGS